MFERLSIRALLVVPLMALPVALAAVVGWLSYNSAAQGIDEMALRLQESTRERVLEQTDAFFANWRYVLEATKGTQTRRDELEARLWKAATTSSLRPSNVYFGSGDGRFVGLELDQDGAATLWLREQPGNEPRQIFRKRHREAPWDLVGPETNSLEPRQRPWFLAVVDTPGDKWSPVYSDHNTGRPTLTLSAAQRDEHGVLQGIYATDVGLAAVSTFLRKQTVLRYGLAYIVTREGRMIASSLDEPRPAEPSGAQPRGDGAAATTTSAARLVNVLEPAASSHDPALAASYSAIAPLLQGQGAARHGDHIDTTVDTPAGAMMVSVTPWGLEAGVDGWLVVALRKNLLTAGIEHNAWRTALLTTLAALAALAIGSLVVRLLMREISGLTHAAEELSGTHAPAPLASHRSDELGRLSRAFDRMVERVNTSNDGLRRRDEDMSRTVDTLAAEMAARDSSEQRLRNVADAMGEALVIVDAQGRLTYANRMAQVLTRSVDEQSLLGRTISDDLPRSAQAVAAKVREAAAKGEPLTSEVFRFGSQWLELRAFPSPQGMAVFVADVTARHLALQAVAEREGQLRQLAGRLLTSQSEERRTIARELHDEIGQQLAALRINLQVMLARTRSGELATADAARLDDSLGIVKEVIAQVRNRALDLHPAILDDLGLAAALGWMAERQSQRSGVAITLHDGDALPALAPQVGLACYRIAQEAINNAVRHGEATRIDLHLGVQGGQVTMTIVDDGKGFDAAAAGAATTVSSLGLLGMRERAQQLGGMVVIMSSPTQGTRVEVRMPIGEAAGTGDASVFLSD